MTELADNSGDSIVVVRWPGDATSVPLAGAIVRNEGPAFVTRFANKADWAAGEAVLIIVVTEGERVIAAGEFLENEGYHPVFRAIGPWRPLNRRESPRYATELRAEVANSEGDWAFAQIMDISMGGARLAVSENVEGAEVEVAFWALGQRGSLTCDVVSSSGGQLGFELRVRFRELSFEQHRLIGDVVRLLATVEEGGFGRLAS